MIQSWSDKTYQRKSKSKKHKTKFISDSSESESDIVYTTLNYVLNSMNTDTTVQKITSGIQVHSPANICYKTRPHSPQKFKQGHKSWSDKTYQRKSKSKKHKTKFISDSSESESDSSSSGTKYKSKSKKIKGYIFELHEHGHHRSKNYFRNSGT
jgi:hypothetical protein